MSQGGPVAVSLVTCYDYDNLRQTPKNSLSGTGALSSFTFWMKIVALNINSPGYYLVWGETHAEWQNILSEFYSLQGDMIECLKLWNDISEQVNADLSNQLKTPYKSGHKCKIKCKWFWKDIFCQKIGHILPIRGGWDYRCIISSNGMSQGLTLMNKVFGMLTLIG